MLVALTGTPGTGKTSVAEILRKKNICVVDFNKTVSDKGFIIGVDKKRDSKIVDIDRFDDFIKHDLKGKDFVFIEGHLSHLLKSVDKVILLRLHPEKLKMNLLKKGWSEEKIKENLDAEILDIILCETIEIHSKKDIFEINITDKTIEEVALIILEIVKSNFKIMKNYKIGRIDWSEEILKDFN